MKQIIVILIVLISSCNKNKEDSKHLIDCSFVTSIENKAFLSSYFKNRIVPIVPDTSETIGIINKIIKSDSTIYILHDFKSIAIFNYNGIQFGRLLKLGQGPNEYNEILDFDVFNNRICVLSYKQINEYNYDGDLLKHINIDFVANKFKYTNNGILFQTSMHEKVLIHTDNDGNINKTYLKRDLSNRLTRDIPFTKISKSEIIYQIGYTNDLIVYNFKTSEFSNAKFTNKDNSLSHSIYEKLLTLFGNEADNKIKKYVFYDGVTYYENHLILPFLLNDNVNLLLFNQKTNICLNLPVNCAQCIIDDISYTEPLFIQSLSITQSDDSFMTFIYAYKIKEGINNFLELYPEYKENDNYIKMRQLLSSIQDDNIILIELII